jgi:hypothetical protein
LFSAVFSFILFTSNISAASKGLDSLSETERKKIYEELALITRQEIKYFCSEDFYKIPEIRGLFEDKIFSLKKDLLIKEKLSKFLDCLKPVAQNMTLHNNSIDKISSEKIAIIHNKALLNENLEYKPTKKEIAEFLDKYRKGVEKAIKKYQPILAEYHVETIYDLEILTLEKIIEYLILRGKTMKPFDYDELESLRQMEEKLVEEIGNIAIKDMELRNARINLHNEEIGSTFPPDISL